MVDDSLQLLQDKIGQVFDDTERLKAALTHSSTGAERNYERLEFLGDRVLGLVMAVVLFESFPDENEGDLAKRFAALVQGKTLARIAQHINLGDVMQFSDAERAAGGAENENILADGMEAVIGAFYLDSGLEACRRLIVDLWGDSIHVMKKPPQDPKTGLQEWSQARSLPLPVYKVVGRDGPDHAPIFQIEVMVQGYPPWRTTGSSRRRAEKDAAAMLLAHLEEIES